MYMRKEFFMAPKNKFTKEQIVAAALNVVREGGISSLTAKTLAEKLGTSTRPIFTAFATMDNLKNEMRSAAENTYKEYVAEGLKEKIPFLGLGMKHIHFAQNEPELYRFLFLTSSPEKNNCAFDAMQQALEAARPSLMSIYRITAEEADFYFRDMWLVVHSLSALMVSGGVDYSPKEIGEILSGFSLSICKAIKEIPGFASGDFDKDKLFKEIIGKDEK